MNHADIVTVIQQNSGGQYSHPLLQLAIAGIEIKTQLANVNNHFDIELIIERHSSLVPIRLLLDLIEHTITTLPVSVRGAVIPHIQALIATRYAHNNIPFITALFLIPKF